ncbi:MAG: amidohydrolase family protein [Alphaproteobacteria bacterium]|nr:amidohydrolase family protein [Alphaproteobacteria bacterium]
MTRGRHRARIVGAARIRRCRVTERDPLAMLAFHLKLAGHRTTKNVLISVGSEADKSSLLPALRQLDRLDVALFATPGTQRFLASNGIEATLIHKIADGQEPNILSFLSRAQLDLVVNIPSGRPVHEEKTDGQHIRSLAIENLVPLVTDVEVARQTIDRMARPPAPAAVEEPWNLKRVCLELAAANGGFCNYHAHFDKAYLITQENLKLSQVDMQKKWHLYRYLKENYTHDDLVTRISRAVETMIAQGVTHCRTFVDADSTVGLLPIQAARHVREIYGDRIHLEFAIQPLEGVLDPESRKRFVEACALADIVGGLPSRDRPTPEKHLDLLFSIAKDLDKPIDVHIDQENQPYEDETELLALKTIEHGYEGRVTGVHAISVAAKPPVEQERILKRVKDAGMHLVICPSAALSMKPHELNAPIHNSIAPLQRILDADVPVHLGIDNMHDLFMPIVDGDMWTECRMLMEATRFYDIEKVMAIACDRSGFGL